MLARTLRRWKFDVLTAGDGLAAWDVLQRERPPLVICDWMMPGLDGPELCRHVRADEALAATYILLLTSRDGQGDLVSGLEAGADDYLVKPFDQEELRARVQAGARLVTLQRRLAEQVEDLQRALSKVRQLEGLLPICSYCKRIRSDENYWQQIEGYVSDHSNAQFSHGICPPCFEKVAREWDMPAPPDTQSRASNK